MEEGRYWEKAGEMPARLPLTDSQPCRPWGQVCGGQWGGADLGARRSLPELLAALCVCLSDLKLFPDENFTKILNFLKIIKITKILM